MKISIKVTQPEKQLATCLIVGVYEDGTLTPAAKRIDETSGHYITKLIKKAVFQGKIGQFLPLFVLPESDADRILLVGCGPAKPMPPITFKKIILASIKTLHTYKIDQATCYLTELDVAGHDLPWKVKQLAETVFEASYRFDVYKKEKDAVVLNELVIPLSNAQEEKLCQTALKQGLAIADGSELTKNLGNLPSNVCTPTYLANEARALAKNYPALKVKVIGEDEMEKLGMGAILGVAKGSHEEAHLITLEYHGSNGNEAPVALVGKGITFDTGGNSLKSPENMVGMKYDMCGAATVLGVMKALAELKLPINVVGVIAAVENMPGGGAYKPEDILTGLSGQTIEVISTDAEGRLILSDALTYCERFNPKVVIDIATLTGAVVIALGHHATGLLSNNEKLSQALLEAGKESNDRAWALPLWDDYQEQLKSPFADMANTGGRAGGAITAGCFLSRFAKKFNWAHLDVAGTAAMMMGTTERQATGRPVPLLMQYLINQASE